MFKWFRINNLFVSLLLFLFFLTRWPEDESACAVFAAPLYFFRYSAGGFGQIRAIKVLCSVQFHVWIISCSSEIRLSVKHSSFSSTLLLLDGSHIGWKRDIIWSESSKGIQMEHSPVISHTILIRLRLKTLWSGWPTPNKKGELGSNICLDAVWISWGFRRSHSLEFVYVSQFLSTVEC